MGRWRLLVAALAGLLAASCGRGSGGGRPELKLQVHVVQARRQEVAITREYVGQTQAVKTVAVRARVRGYLEKALFQEGSDVKKGELLFVIEQAPYRAALDQAKADLAKAKAAAENAGQQWKRISVLFNKNVASQSDLDAAVANRDEAQAQVKSATAAVEQAKLDLSYTEVRSPLSGRAGRIQVDVGNLVGASGETVLTTVVQLDPIYVYFNPPESDRIDVLQGRAKGRYLERSQIGVQASMADGTRFPKPGRIDFVSNTVDPKDGTVQVRAVFPNPEALILPGQFAKVHVVLGREAAVLIPSKAVIEEQGGARVLVVGPNDQVQNRPVQAGRSIGKERVIESGLEPGDRVLVDNLQRARPGMKVTVLEGGGAKQAASSGGGPQKAD